MKKISAILTMAVATVACSNAYDVDLNIGPDFNNAFQSQPATLAPVNTVVWFVASVDAALGTFGASTSLTPGQLLGPDDTLVRQSKVDSNGPGYLVDILTGVPTNIGTQNIFVLLFGNVTATGTPNHTPVDGNTFGFASLGVKLPPGFGNADWSPIASVIGNTHQITAIPEPSDLPLGHARFGGLGWLSSYAQLTSAHFNSRPAVRLAFLLCEHVGRAS